MYLLICVDVCVDVPVGVMRVCIYAYAHEFACNGWFIFVVAYVCASRISTLIL